MSLLKLTAVNKAFGSLEAVKNVECSIAEGEVVGIIGPNGAGKSTLFNLITGDLSVDSGEILFLGQPITTVPTHKRCIAGIGRSYQIPLPFEGLSTSIRTMVPRSVWRFWPFPCGSPEDPPSPKLIYKYPSDPKSSWPPLWLV